MVREYIPYFFFFHSFCPLPLHFKLLQKASSSGIGSHMTAIHNNLSGFIIELGCGSPRGEFIPLSEGDDATAGYKVVFEVVMAVVLVSCVVVCKS